MIAIRSLEDLEQATLSPGVRRAALDAIANLIDACTEPGRPYDPDVDGHVIVLDDPADNEALRHVMGCSLLLEATLEGVSYDRECGCFVAVALTDNQHGWTLILDALTLNGRGMGALPRFSSAAGASILVENVDCDRQERPEGATWQ
jgi:hypothetical protein